MNENWSAEEERLRAALHAAARDVNPGPDGLAQIRRRTAHSPWWRNPVYLGVAAGVATAGAAIVIAVNSLGTGGDRLSVVPADSPTTTQPAPATGEPTTGPADPTDAPSATPDTEVDPDAEPPGDSTDPPEARALPVYYALDGSITREWRRVATDDPLMTAVDQALNGDPFDPRYTSLWAPVEVISADVVDGLIEIDLRSPVELNADADLADQAVQQLVYTATATAATVLDDVTGALPVRILVDGSAPDHLFGGLDLTEPVTRAEETSVRYVMQIDSPAYGAKVTSPVTVRGVAAAFEATVEWELRRGGEVVDSGFTMTGEAGRFSEYLIELGQLDPGDYVITVREGDASGGEGPPIRFDTKAFTVAAP